MNELSNSNFATFEHLALDDEVDEFHPEYDDENGEVFFDDALLHKDFELFFFDDEFDDEISIGLGH